VENGAKVPKAAGCMAFSLKSS